MHRHTAAILALLPLSALLLAATALADEPAAAPPAEEAKPAPPAPPPPAAPAAKAPLVSATPYGFVHAAYYRNVRGFSARDYPGQATADGGSDLLSARASRLGLKLALLQPALGAKVTGVIEADFKGGYVPSSFTTTTTTTCTGSSCKSTSTTSGSAASTSWTSPLFRIRHANVKATWATAAGSVAVTAGQDWALLAPLSPTTLAFAADQLFTAAGNLNRRAPQLKVAYEGPGEAGASAAVAALSPTDATTPVDNGSGNRARRPDLEARLAGFYRAGGKTVVEVGVSGHDNVRSYVVSGKGKDVEEWAGAVDAVANLPYLTLHGEAFVGRAIDDTYAGIAPSVNTAKADAAVGTRGFWAQAVGHPAALVDLVLGYGAESPRGADLKGVAARTNNILYGGGVILNAHPAWKVALEAFDTISCTQVAAGTVTRLESLQLALATRLDF
jgi:hypothetical protein